MEGGKKMTEKYLSIRESLGYQNLKTALMNVFNVNLSHIEIIEGEYENFIFDLDYKKYKIRLIIASTEKNVQFQFGKGGSLSILISNPNYPIDDLENYDVLWTLIEDKSKQEQIRHAFGSDETALEKALEILKEYLDNRSEKNE